MQEEHIIDIIEKYDRSQGGIISILEDIQSKYSYLPADALKIVSKKTGCSLVEIYSIATFYKSFSLKPRGRHIITVCMGTACHVRGGLAIVESFERQLGIKAGETTVDTVFSLETVNCLGACALGPIVVIDGHYFSKVAASNVIKIIKKAREGIDRIEVKTDARVFPVKVRCPRCNHSLMDNNYYIDGYPSVRVIVSFGSRHGWLRVSSLYGSNSVEQQYERPPDTIAHHFCPHCHSELLGTSRCPECGAPMVLMIVSGGGVVQICSRRECKGHILDMNHKLSNY